MCTHHEVQFDTLFFVKSKSSIMIRLCDCLKASLLSLTTKPLCLCVFRTVWGTWGWPRRASDWRECLNSCRPYTSKRSSLAGWVCLLAHHLCHGQWDRLLAVGKIEFGIASKPSRTWKPVCLRALWRTKSIIAHLPKAHCQGWSINKLDWEVWTRAFCFSVINEMVKAVKLCIIKQPRHKLPVGFIRWKPSGSLLLLFFKIHFRNGKEKPERKAQMGSLAFPRDDGRLCLERATDQ